MLLKNAKGILTVPSRDTGYLDTEQKEYILALELLQFQRQLERRFQIWTGESLNLFTEGILFPFLLYQYMCCQHTPLLEK